MITIHKCVFCAFANLRQIEDYPPGNTIVIVPDKLQKFYADTNVPGDPYPWNGELVP